MNQKLFHQNAERQLKLVYQPEAGHSLLVNFSGLIGLTCEFGFQLHNSIDLTYYFLRKGKVALSPGLSMGFDEPGIMRISFGCIGLSNMYESSLKAEKYFLEKELLAVNHKSLSSSVETNDDQVIQSYYHSQSRAFEKGRSEIIEGFMRMEKAVEALLQYNNMQQSREIG